MILSQIYNAFNPTPLPANSKWYVDCKEVRGGSNVLVELGKTIRFSDTPTCQLYTGHRGGGKSTELLRLKQDLETKGCTVVYFSAEDQDINPEDVEYTDILIACTRHLLETIREADPQPVLSWFQDRKQAFEDLMLTEINLSNAGTQVGIGDLGKITASFKTQPTQRAKLRKELNPYTEKLIDALNQFIDDAKQKLPADKQRLVLIADGLEKVTLITNEGGRSNHQEIFIDRAEQLKGLACDVIYTVPISLALSRKATDLMENYNCPLPVLPMIMTHTPDNDDYTDGIEKLKQIIRMRIDSIEDAQGLALETEVFDSAETLNKLCEMSGGHVRNLVLLVQTAIKYNEKESLPIDADALQQAIRQLRKTYRDTVDSNQWNLLAGVHATKQIINDDAHRSLLFTRCLLEYCEEESWHDVHPLLKDVSEFKAAFKQLQDQTKRSSEQVNDS